MPSNPNPQPNTAQAGESLQSLQAQIDAFNQQLQAQVEAFGRGADSAKLHELALKGATAEQLKFAKSLVDQKRALSSAAEAPMKMAAGVRALQSAAQGLIASGDSAGKAVSSMAGALSAIPHPAAQAAGAIIGVVGSVISALEEQTLKQRKLVVDAFKEMAAQAHSLHQAILAVQVGTLTQGIGEIAEFAAEAPGLAAIPGVMEQAVGRVAERMTDAVALMERLQRDPGMRVLNQQVAMLRGRQQAEGMRINLAGQAAQGGAQARGMQAGLTPEQARDEAAVVGMRERLVQQLMQQGLSEADARERVRGELGNDLRALERFQFGVRAANAAIEIIARNRTPVERANQRGAALQEAQRAGAVNPDQAMREERAIFMELADSVQGTMNRLPPALIEGSQEAATAVAAAQREQQGADRGAQLIAIQEAQREYLEAVAREAPQITAALRALRNAGGGI